MHFSCSFIEDIVHIPHVQSTYSEIQCTLKNAYFSKHVIAMIVSIQYQQSIKIKRKGEIFSALSSSGSQTLNVWDSSSSKRSIQTHIYIQSVYLKACFWQVVNTHTESADVCKGSNLMILITLSCEFLKVASLFYICACEKLYGLELGGGVSECTFPYNFTCVKMNNKQPDCSCSFKFI